MIMCPTSMGSHLPILLTTLSKGCVELLCTSTAVVVAPWRWDVHQELCFFLCYVLCMVDTLVRMQQTLVGPCPQAHITEFRIGADLALNLPDDYVGWRYPCLIQSA
jgi:hypothetical protein